MNELLTLSAVELARRIRAGEVSPTEVLETHVARIEEVNPHINAVVQKIYDRARVEAKDAEKRLAQPERLRGALPALFAVPCTVKEHFAFAGLPNTAGLLKRKNAVAKEDSTPVRRLREAGLIPMATTNVPEALTWHESYNKVYGRTTNAYSTRHSAGGSSGGEGAILGAAASPIGLGGDIGGSIRIPALFNGVVGHKATGGRVAETGAWPGARGMIARYKVIGPLGRRIADMKALMPYLAQPDGKDLSVDGPPWGEAPAYDPRKLKVFWFDDNGVMSPTREVKATVDKTAAALRDMGFQVEEWRPKGLERSLEIWANALEHAGGPKFIDTLGDFEGVDLWGQWRKFALGKSDHIFPCLALATVEHVLARFPSWGRKMADMRLEIRAEIEGRLGTDGVLLCPAFHRTAPKHGLESFLHTFGFAYSGGLNPMELPATSVPTGFSKKGLPLGVQVAGSRNNDHLTLFVAERVEEAFGGWKPGPIQGVGA